MVKLEKNKTALTLGAFFAVIHAVWALWIAVNKESLQNLLNWIFNVHFLEPYWIITSFNFLGAIFLVIATFIIGYIFGWVFAVLWNWLHKK